MMLGAERLVDLSVIVPAYNEEGIIVRTVEEIKRVLESASIDYEIVVVDDGSEDNTYLVVKKHFSKDQRVKVVRKENGGKGSAIRYGFEFTRGKYVAFIDADLEIHPKYLVYFLEFIKNKNFDVIIGTKRTKGALYKFPAIRRALSRGYWLLVKMLFNLKSSDFLVGIKAFKREVLEDVFPRIMCKQYAFDVELLVNIEKRGYKVGEYPVVIKFNRDKNRILIGSIWKILLDTLAIYYRDKILHYYDRQVGGNRNEKR